MMGKVAWSLSGQGEVGGSGPGPELGCWHLITGLVTPHQQMHSEKKTTQALYNFRAQTWTLGMERGGEASSIGHPSALVPHPRGGHAPPPTRAGPVDLKCEPLSNGSLKLPVRD